MNKPDLDLCADYLFSTFGAATATGLSAILEGQVSFGLVKKRIQYSCLATKQVQAPKREGKKRSNARNDSSVRRTVRT